MCAQIWCRASTSTPRVGSSRIKSGGSCSNARAIASRRCIPPENPRTTSRARPRSPTSPSTPAIRPSTVEGAAAGDGAPRMSCSTDDHRANSLAERVGGTKRQRKNRQTRAVRLLIDYWGRAEGFKHAPEEERDATSEPDAERAFEGAVDSGKAARVVSSFFPIDVTRRPPLTLL